MEAGTWGSSPDLAMNFSSSINKINRIVFKTWLCALHSLLGFKDNFKLYSAVGRVLV